MSFREFVSGNISTAIEVYCCQCSAGIVVCRPDVPDITPEAVEEMWNQRVVVLELEQLRSDNARIRGDLREFIDEHEECSDEDGWTASMCSLDALHNAGEALDRTPDESFGEVQKLREEVAQVMQQRNSLLAELLRVKEICLRECGIGIVNEIVISNAKGGAA